MLRISILFVSRGPGQVYKFKIMIGSSEYCLSGIKIPLFLVSEVMTLIILIFVAQMWEGHKCFSLSAKSRELLVTFLFLQHTVV